MAGNTAFTPQGKTITLQTSATPSTSQNRQVKESDFAISTLPSQFRIVNNGSADIWIVLSSTSAPTAAFPTAGTTTVGTPQPGIRVKAGLTEVIGNPAGPSLFIADICSVASQTYDITAGEGL